MGGDLRDLQLSARGSEPQIERAVGKWLPGKARKDQRRGGEVDAEAAEDSASLEMLLEFLPLVERLAQRRG